jgi:SAM-dependent methyltransferase
VSSAGGAPENELQEEANAALDFDPQLHRAESLAGWQAAAPGWVRQQSVISRFGAPVSGWMLDAVKLRRGERVLELAAGLGETGMLAAELIAPLGGVIISDQADAMLDGARARAAELELSNVEFQTLNAEWIDLPLASVDVVLCRWGYMLMADPRAALTETRRVLRPHGRVALAVWDAIEDNPWARLPGLELIERGVVERPAPGTPGPFALASRERLRELLEEAGFTELGLDAVDVMQRHVSFDAYWEMTLDVSPGFHDAVLSRPEPEIDEIRSGLAERMQPFTDADGHLAIPGRSLVAAAVA